MTDKNSKLKTARELYDENDIKNVFDFAEWYKDFLSSCKTERECVNFFVDDLEKRWYTSLDSIIKSWKKIKCWDKIYATNMDKNIAIFNIWKDDLSEGLNILWAHIDSPRLDAKQNPFYEEWNFAYLDTHYYWWIKKYQWVTIPLALHWIVVKKDWEKVIINIWEDENDPVFFISDLLPHLAKVQMEKTASKLIEWENLDVILWNIPLKDGDKDFVLANCLKLIKEKYNTSKEDFISWEIEIVPAWKARDAWFDRWLILWYGHDDRVCAYSSYQAIVNTTTTDRTVCCLLVDKEEIWSVWATWMQSNFFENTVAEIQALYDKESPLMVRRILKNSIMLSSDVDSGFDPTFGDCFDRKNTSFLWNWVAFCKFTWYGWKYDSNDANAEYVARIRAIMDNSNVKYQFAELWKVDLWWWWTIAYILSLYGMQVIDCGVPVLNMHAPHEAISKADLYESQKAYIAFLNSK